MEKKVLLVVLVCFCFHISYNQEIDKIFNDFQSSNWEMVLKAKNSLENMEAKSIPGLIKLLDNNSTVKLENTGTLIYPGAERFFGYGQIIAYDIDNIPVRAGWLLEELAFQNFGYSGVHIEDYKLIDHIKVTFPEYYNNSGNRKELQSSSTADKRKLIMKLSQNKVNEWWDKEADKWNRLDALVDALNSNDEKRQVKALFYIRNGKTKCSGLNKSVFESKIKSRIIELSKVNLQRVSEHAKLILLDDELEWLKMKQNK